MIKIKLSEKVLMKASNITGILEIIRGGFRTAATSKMERFIIIVQAVNYYLKALHLGCCSSPRSASDPTS